MIWFSESCSQLFSPSFPFFSSFKKIEQVRQSWWIGLDCHAYSLFSSSLSLSFSFHSWLLIPSRDLGIRDVCSLNHWNWNLDWLFISSKSFPFWFGWQQFWSFFFSFLFFSFLFFSFLSFPFPFLSFPFLSFPCVFLFVFLQQDSNLTQLTSCLFPPSDLPPVCPYKFVSEKNHPHTWTTLNLWFKIWNIRNFQELWKMFCNHPEWPFFSFIGGQSWNLWVSSSFSSERKEIVESILWCSELLGIATIFYGVPIVDSLFCLSQKFSSKEWLPWFFFLPFSNWPLLFSHFPISHFPIPFLSFGTRFLSFNPLKSGNNDHCEMAENKSNILQIFSFVHQNSRAIF